MSSGLGQTRLDYPSRLRRARLRAHLRYDRRHCRSLQIWEHFRNYYGRQPGLSSALVIVDELAGRRVRWSYEDSVHLEDQAYMLWQRLRLLS